MTREEAINALKLINLKSVHPFLTWEEMLEVGNMAIAALQEPEQKWIPVSERLPENDGRYLCFWGTNGMEVLRFSNDLYAVDDYDFQEYKYKKKKGFYDYSGEWGYLEIDYVTAWMPLPEPYKE